MTRETKRSDFYPQHPPSLENHHAVLHRQSHVLFSHTDQLMAVQQRLTELGKVSPATEIHELEQRVFERVAKIETDFRVEVARVRTAIYVAAVLIGGASAGGKVLEVLQPPTPIVVQAPKGP